MSISMCDSESNSEVLSIKKQSIGIVDVGFSWFFPCDAHHGADFFMKSGDSSCIYLCDDAGYRVVGVGAIKIKIYNKVVCFGESGMCQG